MDKCPYDVYVEPKQFSVWLPQYSDKTTEPTGEATWENWQEFPDDDLVCQIEAE